MRVLDRLLWGVEAGGALGALSVLLALALYQAVARNVGLPVLLWADPLSHQLVLLAGLCGASLAVRQQGHIRLEVASHVLSAVWQRRINSVLAFVGAGVCVLLARAAYTFMEGERALSEGTVAGLPSWIFVSMLPVGFMLMALRFVLLPFLPPIEREVPGPDEEAAS